MTTSTIRTSNQFNPAI